MRSFCGTMTKPCMANMVPGGRTPILPPEKLHDIGYKLALYPVILLSSAVAAMQTTLAALHPDATTPHPQTVSFADLQRVVGFPEYWTRETLYQAKE
jgi:2-methylisocitrate lyase-like PEP mutase family enzyme